MAVVTVVSVKHAPGATTLALLLTTAADPFTLPLLLEADPSGGDLAARVGTLFDPGMGSLVEAARGASFPGMAEQHCRLLSSGVGVVVGSVSPRRIDSYLDDAAKLLAEPLRRRGGLAVVDAGRWGAPSTTSWAELSDAVVVAMKPTVESAEHVAVRLPHLLAVNPTLQPVVIGQGPLSAEDVADIVEHPVLAVPHDPATARMLCDGIADHDLLRTTPLWLAAEVVLGSVTTAIATARVRRAS